MAATLDGHSVALRMIARTNGRRCEVCVGGERKGMLDIDDGNNDMVKGQRCTLRNAIDFATDFLGRWSTRKTKRGVIEDNSCTDYNATELVNMSREPLVKQVMGPSSMNTAG